MGLSIAELELQASECLPAREVLTILGGGGKGGGTSVDDVTKTIIDDSQDALGGIAVNADVENIQVGLVNVQDVQAFNDNNLFTGHDNDVVDVLNGSFNGKDNDVLDLAALNALSKSSIG